MALAATGLAADLATKDWAFENHFPPQGPESAAWWIPGILGIQTSFNGGGLFGFFQGGSWWLAGLSFVALAGLTAWLFLMRMATSRYMTVVLALITGGILGNLHDRMGFGYDSRFPEQAEYHVRDWIHFRLDGVPFLDPWPNFNIADSLLVTGAILILAFAYFMPHAMAGERTDSRGAGKPETAAKGSRVARS